MAEGSNLGVVAQLVRASACHAEGRGFESRSSRQFFKPVSSPKRAFFLGKFRGLAVVSVELLSLPFGLFSPNSGDYKAANFHHENLRPFFRFSQTGTGALFVKRKFGGWWHCRFIDNACKACAA